jgi:hypothetical protein
MNGIGSPVLQNLKAFAAAYPIAILATGSAAIATDRAYYFLFAPDTEGSLVSQFYDIIPLFYLVLFLILLVPCGIAFAILKFFRLNGLKAYLVASTLMACILVTFLAFIMAMHDSNVGYDYYLKNTWDVFVAIAPSVLVGALVFQKIEQKIVRGNEQMSMPYFSANQKPAQTGE